MRFILFLLLMVSVPAARAQSDSSTWVRAFPITGYVVSLNDSTSVVQIQLPEGVRIAEKQLGLVRGVYRDNKPDTAVIGYGRCQLIKGDYYYFSIDHHLAPRPPLGGDLLFVRLPRKPVFAGKLISLAQQFIGLIRVTGEPFFDRYSLFDHSNRIEEEALLDSMVADIRFTGDYFLKENPSMNQLIETGPFKGRKVLDAMIVCRRKDLLDFLEYMIARPRLYAGAEWKISEIFATWLTSGAPMVIHR